MFDLAVMAGIKPAAFPLLTECVSTLLEAQEFLVLWYKKRILEIIV